MAKKKLLITGASGLLGYALCQRAIETYDVYGVCHKGDISVEGVTPIKADLTDRSQLANCFEKVQPQAVIHAAALSQPNDCEQQPEMSEQVNLQATIEIARLCAMKEVPLVFTSSDLVFNGEAAPYREDAIVSPICVYGRHKADAEKAIREIYPDATICRMPLLLGYAPGTSSGFLGHMVRTLRAGQPLTLFTNEFRTAVDMDSAALGLLLALRQQETVLHLGGRIRLSRFTLGCLVADVLRVGHALLKPLQITDLPMAAPRSPDVSLDSKRAYALGYTPADITTALETLVPRFDTAMLATHC